MSFYPKTEAEWKAAEKAAGRMLCRCGCGMHATHRVRGVDDRGERYDEGACIGAAQYLAEASAEVGADFEMEELPCKPV